MRVLVTGGSGYIGNAVTEAFCRTGHSVAATVTSSGKSRLVERFGARAIHWDLKDFRTLKEEIQHCDVLVHAAMNPGADGGTLDRECVTFFLETLESSKGLRRFLYTSGVWVLGNTRGQNIPDNTIPEHSPSVVSWRPPVERLVLESAGRGLTPLVIRPGLVYGGAGGIIGFLLANATREKGVEIIGNGQNHWSPVHRDDLADLYVRAAECGPVATIHNATDGSCPTVAMVARALSQALGYEGRISMVDEEEARKRLGGFAEGLLLDQCIVGDLSSRLLGWTPRHRSIVSEAEAQVRSWKASQESRS
ncbi:MAG: NAD-dependent epimerase/dehydratase family protein [Leptospirillia bacterium]